MKHRISVVIPCYFNEENIPVTTAALIRNEDLFSPDVRFEYVFVDDGSEDGTLHGLKEFKQQHPSRVTIVKLASNVGSYNAIYAGLRYASGDCIVVMAADLQDPPELMRRMYDEWKTGVQVVLASRETESGVLAAVFHWVLRKVALPNLPSGGFDYCLFDKAAKNRLLQRMQPDIISLFLLLAMGFKCTVFPYRKRVREIGSSRWTTSKKVKLAWNTLCWFSLHPDPMADHFSQGAQAKPSAPYVIESVF